MKKSFISIIRNTKKRRHNQRYRSIIFCCSLVVAANSGASKRVKDFLCFILNYIHLFLFAFQPTDLFQTRQRQHQFEAA